MKKLSITLAIAIPLILMGFLIKTSIDTANKNNEAIAEQSTSSSIANKDSNTAKYIQQVKDGHPLDYPNTTYSKVFDKFFTSPSWKYLKSDKGKELVEFSGGCTYQGDKLKVRLQFLVNVKTGEVTLSDLYFNDKAQTNITRAEFIRKIFGEEVKRTETSGDNSSSGAGSTSKAPAMSKDRAVFFVTSYISTNSGKVPSKIEVTAEAKDSYTVHAYAGEGEKDVIEGWFKVIKATGEVEAMN